MLPALGLFVCMRVRHVSRGPLALAWAAACQARLLFSCLHAREEDSEDLSPAATSHGPVTSSSELGVRPLPPCAGGQRGLGSQQQRGGERGGGGGLGRPPPSHPPRRQGKPHMLPAMLSSAVQAAVRCCPRLASVLPRHALRMLCTVHTTGARRCRCSPPHPKQAAGRAIRQQAGGCGKKRRKQPKRAAAPSELLGSSMCWASVLVLLGHIEPRSRLCRLFCETKPTPPTPPVSTSCSQAPGCDR